MAWNLAQFTEAWLPLFLSFHFVQISLHILCSLNFTSHYIDAAVQLYIFSWNLNGNNRKQAFRHQLYKKWMHGLKYFLNFLYMTLSRFHFMWFDTSYIFSRCFLLLNIYISVFGNYYSSNEALIFRFGLELLGREVQFTWLSHPLS